MSFRIYPKPFSQLAVLKVSLKAEVIGFGSIKEITFDQLYF